MSVDAYQHELRATAAPSTYIVFGALEAFALFAAVFFAVHTRLTWLDVLSILGFPTILIMWVYAFRLEVSNELLSYRTLFRGTRSIAVLDRQRENSGHATSTPRAIFQAHDLPVDGHPQQAHRNQHEGLFDGGHRSLD